MTASTQRTVRHLIEPEPDGPFGCVSGAEEAGGVEWESRDLNMVTGLGHVYNEGAFRYFLEIERRRTDASGRPFLLLLIEIDREGAAPTAMDDGTAEQIFGALAACLRDTDFVGWYRKGRIAGGVLTQDAERMAADMVESVTDRVRAALAETLASAVLRRAQVRVYQVPAPVRGPA